MLIDEVRRTGKRFRADMIVKRPSPCRTSTCQEIKMSPSARYDHRVLFLSGTWERPGNEFRFRATILVGKDGSADGSIYWQAMRVHGHPANYFATEWVHGFIRGRDVELEGHKVEPGLWPDSYRITLSGDGEAGTFGGVTRTCVLDWGGRIYGQYLFRNRNA